MNTNGVTDTYKAMVEEIITNGDSTVISNINYAHAVYLTVKQYDRAEKKAEIITGSFAEETGDTSIRDAFCSMVKRIASNNGKVRVITTAYKAIPNWLETLHEKYQEALDIVFAQLKDPNNPVEHWITLDDKMYRREEPHKGFECQDVHASVCFNDPVKAKEQSGSFDKIWGILKAA